MSSAGFSRGACAHFGIHPPLVSRFQFTQLTAQPAKRLQSKQTRTSILRLAQWDCFAWSVLIGHCDVLCLDQASLAVLFKPILDQVFHPNSSKHLASIN